MTNDNYSVRYPIGEYSPLENPSQEDIQQFISTIQAFPNKLREAVKDLSDEQLDTPYREGGWTIRQVIHHAADSHMNSYTRFKLGLTEDTPTIRPYDEAKWAELKKAKSGELELSLPLLEAIHKRMVVMLKNISGAEWGRKYVHPETGKAETLEHLAGLYAWHSEHHLAHIVNLKKKMGW